MVVLACVPDDSGGCDEQLSVSFEVTASSGAFSFTGPDQPFYLFVWKDKDQDGTVDAADLFGEALDQEGKPVLFTGAVGELVVKLEVIPEESGSLPAALVGTWQCPNSIYTFNADGTFLYVFAEYFSGTCLLLTKVESSSEGTASATADQLTITRTSGSYTSYDCQNHATISAVSYAPQVFDYSLTQAENNVPQLHLVYRGSDSVCTLQ